jgi:hypothetical protein
VVREPRGGIGQHRNPLRSERCRQMPQAVAFTLASNEDGGRPPAGRQLPDVASHEDRRRPVPVPAAFEGIGNNAKLSPRGSNDSLHLGTEKGR